MGAATAISTGINIGAGVTFDTAAINFTGADTAATLDTAVTNFTGAWRRSARRARPTRRPDHRGSDSYPGLECPGARSSTRHDFSSFDGQCSG